jgi:hypothetical protein
MISTLSKGMPYATMIYDNLKNGMTMNVNGTKSYVPTIAAEIRVATNPIVDESLPLICHPFSSGSSNNNNNDND